MKPTVIAIAVWAIPFLLISQVSGIVFRDYNLNGSRDSSAVLEEPLLQGYTLKLYGITGLLGTTTTSVNGSYSFNIAAKPPFRLELLNSDPSDFETNISTSTGGSRTTVRFVWSSGESINFGVQYPGDYCEKAKVVAPCYANGDPLPPGSAFSNLESLVSWDINNGGTTTAQAKTIAHGGLAPNVQVLASAQQIGACWALAIQKKTKKLYTLATLKRHTGLGPKGIGGFYQIDLTTNAVIESLDLNTIGIPSGIVPDNLSRGIPSSGAPVSTDSLAFSMIGKVGFGGMDLSEDEKTIYLVNLHNRKIYSIFINSPYVRPDHSKVDSFDIPNPGCQGGDFRPWALKIYKGKVYVGLVCDGGQSGLSSDLSASVYRLDPISRTFTQVMSASLNYPGFFGAPKFESWLNSWDPTCLQGDHVYCAHAQAMLTDLEFEGSDVMILGLADRYGFQAAHKQPDLNGAGKYSIISFGDILRSRRDPSTGLYVLENNGSDGVITTAGKNTGIGPGFGEFYHGDNSLFSDGDVNEEESLTGSLAMCTGRAVLVTSQDPVDLFSSGIIHLSNSNGSWLKRLEIVPSEESTYIGKSTGLGDLIISTPPPPIQIGNYVWKDLNKNGIQDPQEPPLSGVKVQLVRNGTVIATAETNKFGEYLFANDSVSGINEYPKSFLYNISLLESDADFTLRIDGAQAVLNGFVNTTSFAGFPANSNIDNNGSQTSPGILEYSFHTGIDGENNFTYDFGFSPLDPCNISLNHLVISECDPVTNSFYITGDITFVNAPIGFVMIKLSTGESKSIFVLGDGTYHFKIKNIESRGLTGVGVTVTPESNPDCALFILNLFNQPRSCCDHTFELCSNRTKNISLGATPSMAQYRWYKSSDHQVVGFNENLVIDNLFPGLEDNFEGYYFVAIDSTGDTIRQYCPYQVNIIPCCALQISFFMQNPCDNNGTPYNANDDWFSVVINAENPDAGITSRYEVVKNGVVLGSAAYGAPIVIGTGMLPDFRADGVSKYKLEIRDFDDHRCLDSVYTIPAQCPVPKLTVNKYLSSYTILSDASYNVTYKIEVENQGTETGIYNLRDVQAFDDDITIKTAFYTTNIPSRSGAALIGKGPWDLNMMQQIAPGIRHIYTIVMNFSLDLRPSSPGDNLYSSCGSQPKAGQGLFNRALLDSDGDGTFDLLDTACTDIPVYECDKELIQQSQLDLYHHNLVYRIVVRNRGAAMGQYNLIENPTFEDDTRIVAGSFSMNGAALQNLALPKPVNGWILTQMRTIAPNATDTFIVNFKVNLDLRPGSLGDNVYSYCGKQTSGLSRVAEGLFNVAGLDLNNDLRAEIKDTTCGSLPYITHQKYLYDKKFTGVEQNEVTYLFIVENNGGGVGNYSLADQLSFDDDVTVTSALIRVNQDAGVILGPMTHNDKLSLVSNRSLPGQKRDSVFLTLYLRLNLSNFSSGDHKYIRCQKDSSNNFISGTGLFNESQLDINNDNIVDEKDTVCTDFEYYDLALRKISLTPGPAKFGANNFFRILVYNQGTGIVRKVQIADYLTSSMHLNGVLSPGWFLLNDSTSLYTIDSLLPEDSVYIDIGIILSPYHNLSETINTAEIISFLNKDNSPVEDIDSYPDQIRRNDNKVIPESKEDDDILGKAKLNPGEDEDDEDVALIPTFDLALKKRIDTPPPYHYNEILSFKITLFNQGHLTVYSSFITDYIPEGYDFDPILNPGWVLNGRQASLMVTDSLRTGDTLDRFIQLRLKPGTDPRQWINVSEILNASISKRIGVHALISDIDSDFDNIKDNDMGGVVNSSSDDHIDDDGKDSNMDGIKDEDDHDPAVPYIWDLALKKKLLTPSPFFPGDKLDFSIKIYNQGTDTLGRVIIKDYIPEAYQFFALDNPGWILSGNYATLNLVRRVVPGDSTEARIRLVLRSGNKTFEKYINYCEIIDSYNSFGAHRKGFDIDSREDSNNPDEASQKPDQAGDDEIFVSVLDGNEDDHDPAMAKVVDLALMKYDKLIRTVKYGDTVPFLINVYNQGFVPVSSFSLVDYLPMSFTWIDNPGWTYFPGNRYATTAINKVINPGDSVQVQIRLRVELNSMLSGDLVNIAEITAARDMSGIIYNRDIDSQFDFDKFNDTGGIPNSLSDNFLTDDGTDGDGDGIMDEDDADPDVVSLVDFALKKEILGPSSGGIGDTVNFNIKIYNQGNVEASEITVVDYLTNAYQFIPSLNPGWVSDASGVTNTKTATVRQGDSAQWTLKLKVLSTNDPNNYCNYAEVYSVRNRLGIEVADLDADSRPRSNTSTEKLVKPGSSDDNRINGRGIAFQEDEDDHDVAGPAGRARLGDMVWEDRNANGVMDPGEAGIPNVQVQLFNLATIQLVRTAYTNLNGKYQFDDLPPGKYFLKFIPPAGCSFSSNDQTVDSLDSDVNGTFGYGTTGIIMLNSGDDDRTWDAGLYKCLYIDGNVWYDYNKDGVLNLSENGINGILVSLFSYPDRKLQSKILTYSVYSTSYVHDGYYTFCVKPGSYYIVIESLSDFVTSPFKQGSNPSIDSDLDNSNGPFSSYVLKGLSRDSLRNISGGIYNPKFTLGGTSSGISVLTQRSNSELNLVGEQIPEGVRLNFELQNDACLSFYNIYRKAAEDYEFKLLTKVQTDPSQHICDYTFIDTDPVMKQGGWYFVEGLDQEHWQYNSNSVRIYGANYSSSLIIYPNPAHERAVVRYKGQLNGPAVLEIRDLSGKLVMKYNGIMDSEFTLNTESFSEGLYQVQWSDADKTLTQMMQVTHR